MEQLFPPDPRIQRGNRIRAAIGHWLVVLRMEDWDIRYAEGIEPEPECRASVDIWPEKLAAAIYVSELATDAELNQCICHAMLHIVFFELEKAPQPFLDSVVSRNDLAIYASLREPHEEAVIHRLVRAFTNEAYISSVHGTPWPAAFPEPPRG